MKGRFYNFRKPALSHRCETAGGIPPDLSGPFIGKGYRCFRFSGALFTAFLILLSFTATSQEMITITGTVTDTTGSPMPGISITAVGQSGVGTATDLNGKFVIDVQPGTELTITAIGYAEQRITAGEDQQVFTIILQEQTGTLDQVVVTAFGREEQREAVVGSVTSVTPEALKVPSSNLTTALAGRVAGMVAYQRNGQPGQDNASFFIRGVTTFGYKQDPLILVDNIELTPDDLARMQVDDIASFSILKDASATALYGARGANGVILITTKEGREGKAKVHVRFENSISQPTQDIELADPITYMQLYNEALTTRDPLARPLFSQNKIINTQRGDNPLVYPAVNWLDVLFKERTMNQRANFNVSGGGGVARYYIAGSFNQDNGILKLNPVNDFNSNVNLQNYQLRSNINIDITKTTEAIVRLSGNFDDYTGPITNNGSLATDLYNKALHTSPVLFPPYFEPDSANRFTHHILFGNASSVSGGTALYNNPYADLMKGYKDYSRSRMSAQFELKQDLSFFTEGLSFRGIFSTNRYSFFDVTRQYQPFFYSVAYYDRVTDNYDLLWLNDQPGSATEYLDFVPGDKEITTFLYMQGVLNYDRDIGKSNVSASLVATRQQTLNADATDPETGESSLQYSLPYRNIGLAGRATYSYLSRYFLEFNFGYNGSERFSANNRYGFFPTIGFSWVASREKFWEPLSDVVTRLKIRGSYGLVGNDAIGSQRFFYLSEVNLNGGNPARFGLDNSNGYVRNGVSISNYENRDVTWETSRQTNLAMEVSLWDRLEIIAEIYRQERSNILQDRATIPSSMGLEAPISANVGRAESKGIDLSLDYQQNLGPHSWISGRGNFTLTNSKYLYFEEPAYAEPWRYRTGSLINQRFGYIAERLFVDDLEAANAPTQNFGDLPAMGGDIKYRDLNGDGQITERDLTSIGLPTVPELVYGFGISAGFKGFDLSMFFQGLARESFFINPSQTAPFVNDTQILRAYADNRWSEENQNLYALWPRLSTTAVANNNQTSTWWLRDGTFLRLKSLELGYTLPAEVSKQIHLSNLRIYFSGLNLLTWSRFSLWDPEMGGNGFAYPIQKVFNLGVDINL